MLYFFLQQFSSSINYKRIAYVWVCVTMINSHIMHICQEIFVNLLRSGTDLERRLLMSYEPEHRAGLVGKGFKRIAVSSNFFHVIPIMVSQYLSPRLSV